MVNISRNRYYLIVAFLVLALILMPAGAVMLLLGSTFWTGVVLCIAAFGSAICGLVTAVVSPPSARPNPVWATGAQSRSASSPTTSHGTHAI